MASTILRTCSTETLKVDNSIGEGLYSPKDKPADT